MAPRKNESPRGEVGETPADIQAMTFEQAMAELDGIVRRLEAGQVDLEESIAIYSRGAQLRRHCEGKLRAAEAKVETIVVGPDGAAGVAATDSE
jgi:exodeoxyribonuclease VII small subunit